MCCIRGISVAIAIVIGLNLADDSSSSECPQNPESPLKTLKQRLFCNYDRDDVPLNETTKTVVVRYRLYPEVLELYEYTNQLFLLGTAIMEWQDFRLRWNKTEYDGLDSLVVQNKDIWIPDIDIDSYADMDFTSSYLPINQCELSDDGTVTCEISLRYMAHCNPDVQRWPFDSNNCNFSIASKMDRVLFDKSMSYPIKGFMELHEVNTDRYWKTVSIKQWPLSPDESSLMKWPKVVFTISLKRHSGFLMATFFIPSIVMMMATVSTFCLDPEGMARMFLIGANTICHCLLLMYLAWYLPANGDKTPVIVTFFRDSFILVAVSLVITVCAGKMRSAARAPPAWVASIADDVQNSPAQYLLFNGLFTKGDAVDEEESDTVAAVMASSTSTKWRRIATLLDRISLLVFTTIITIISCAFLP